MAKILRYKFCENLGKMQICLIFNKGESLFRSRFPLNFLHKLLKTPNPLFFKGGGKDLHFDFRKMLILLGLAFYSLKKYEIKPFNYVKI